ncbi:MAG: PIN domain-containing protein [Candidatus Eremiobacterota bacterium]
MILYLDMNVYYRVFDDQSQPGINNETKTIELIFKIIEKWNYKLCWSYILERENMAKPSQDIKEDIKTIASMSCSVYIQRDKKIEDIAGKIMENSNAKALDSLHLACAVYGNCDCFITCDDRFIKTINNNKEKLKDIIGSIKVINPLDFI